MNNPDNMTDDEFEPIHEQFWLNAERSVDTVIKEWKERGFTRKQMIMGAVNAFKNNGASGILVWSYIYAVMAERLMKADQKDAAADQTAAE